MSEETVDIVNDLLAAAANTALPVSPELSKGESLKSGIKRFLSPSPQAAGFAELKRTRQTSGDSYIGSMDPSELNADGESAMQTHYLSQPMNPSDITQIAVELKTLMLPEMRAMFKSLMQETQPNFAALLDGVVQKIQTEASAVRKENATLKQENKTLRKQVGTLKTQGSKVEIAADSNEQYSRRNNLRLSGIPITENENTDEIVLKLVYVR